MVFLVREIGLHLFDVILSNMLFGHARQCHVTTLLLVMRNTNGLNQRQLKLSNCFRGEEGMIVDTNVKRVCQRLGWVAEKATPEQTRQTLQSWLPSSLWADISFLFVGFGQQVCKPRWPLCSLCTVNQMCPSACNPNKNR